MAYLFFVLCSLLSERSKDFRTGGGYNGKCSNAIMPIWIGTSEYWYINCEKRKTFPWTHIKFNDTLARLPCNTAWKCRQPRKSYRWLDSDSDWHCSCNLKLIYQAIFAFLLCSLAISRFGFASLSSLNVWDFYPMLHCRLRILKRCNRKSWHPTTLTITIHIYCFNC